MFGVWPAQLLNKGGSKVDADDGHVLLHVGDLLPARGKFVRFVIAVFRQFTRCEVLVLAVAPPTVRATVVDTHPEADRVPPRTPRP